MTFSDLETLLKDLATSEDDTFRERAITCLATVIHNLQEENKQLWEEVNNLSTYHN